MTLDEAIKQLYHMKRVGGVAGDTKLVWDAISHSYDAEFKLTKRSDKPVILVNA